MSWGGRNLSGQHAPNNTRMSLTNCVIPTSVAMARTRPRCGEPEIMCWLCGLRIQQTSTHTGLPPPSIEYNHHGWGSFCRLITFSEAGAEFGDRATISGIGQRRNVDNWYVMPRNRRACTENGVTVVPEEGAEGDGVPQVFRSPPVFDTERRVWTFRVHAACWDVIVSQLPDGDEAETAAATMWARALAALNWPYSFAVRLSYPCKLLDDVESVLELMFLAESPYDDGSSPSSNISPERVPSGAALLVELGQQLLPFFRQPIELAEFGLYTPSGDGWLDGNARTPGCDIFASLPQEILQLVMCFMPTRDMLSLRLASRAAAYASRLRALPQSFWRSRFWPEFERGWALPGRMGDKSPFDWRSLYLLVGCGVAKIDRKTLDRQSWLAQVAKRKLWWTRFGEIVALYRRFGAGAKLLGEPFTWRSLAMSGQQRGGVEPKDGHTLPAASALSRLEAVVKPVRVVTTRLRTSEGLEREYTTTRSSWDALGKTLCGVGVSSMKIRGSVFVTGLRLLFREEEDGLDKTHEERLGYVLPESEGVELLQRGEALHGFKINVNCEAIRGVQLILRRASGKLRVTPWLGESGEWERTDMYSLLLRRSAENPFVLAASFDVSIPEHHVSLPFTRFYGIAQFSRGRWPTFNVTLSPPDSSETQNKRIAF